MNSLTFAVVVGGKEDCCGTEDAACGTGASPPKQAAPAAAASSPHISIRVGTAGFTGQGWEWLWYGWGCRRVIIGSGRWGGGVGGGECFDGFADLGGVRGSQLYLVAGV